jgi:hypothetical protein
MREAADYCNVGIDLQERDEYAPDAERIWKRRSLLTNKRARRAGTAVGRGGHTNERLPREGNLPILGNWHFPPSPAARLGFDLPPGP